MTKEAFDNVVRMISKECCRNDLSELCDYWEVTTKDFDEFFELARRGFEKKVQETKDKGKIMDRTLVNDAIRKSFMAQSDFNKALEWAEAVGAEAVVACLDYIDHRFDALESKIFQAQITTMPDSNYSDEKIVADIDYELRTEARNDTLATDRIARLANRIEFYGRTDAEFVAKNRYWEARVAYLRHGDFPNPGIDRNSPAFTKILKECVEMIRPSAISGVKKE